MPDRGASLDGPVPGGPGVGEPRQVVAALTDQSVPQVTAGGGLLPAHGEWPHMLSPETFTESHPASGGPARPGLTVTYNTDTLNTSFL